MGEPKDTETSTVKKSKKSMPKINADIVDSAGEMDEDWFAQEPEPKSALEL